MKIKTLMTSIANATLEDFVRSISTLGTLGAVIYLYVVGRTVPNELYTLLGVFIGYFFGRVATIGTGTPGQGVAIGNLEPPA